MVDPKDYCDPPKPRSGTEFVDLIDPFLFREKYPDLFKRIFPGNVKIRQGTPIIADEYILVDDEPRLRFLGEHDEFRLEVVVGELRDPIIKVKKYRYCGGKAVVLITSADGKDLDPLYELPLLGRIKAVPTRNGVRVVGKRSGYIKPGGQGTDGTGQDGNTNTVGAGQDGNTNTVGAGQDGNTNTVGAGQDGNTNTVGAGQGYPNAYGFIYPGSGTTGDGVLKSKEDLKGSNDCLKIAILDSGMRYTHPTTDGPTTQSTSGTCLEVSTGWDFVNDDNNPDDEHINRHGTRIAGIIRTVCRAATLIPVRISDENNACTLYNVLCGLEYAAQQRVQLINASWVFTSTQGTYIPLLQASLRRLSFRGIIVVCAAGNIGPVQAGGLHAIPHIGQSKGGLNVPFLTPACSSEVFENVITVTSVAQVPDEREAPNGWDRDGLPTRRTVCELRSKRFVTVGVLTNGDEHSPFGSFKTPDMNNFRGTSFATPYVTAHIANAMNDRADLSSRRDVLRAIGAQRDPDLKKQIRRGMWIEARLPEE